MIESSKDQDTLDVALDMIRLVEDELQRDELVGISRRVAKAIGASESAASQA
jgi:mevalonate pyrophosphate decarboxylase